MGLRAVAAGYPIVVAGTGWTVAAPLGGAHVPLALLILAGLVLFLCVLAAAGCATHAVLSKRWGWGLALVVAWPVAVSAYLWRARPRSEEPDV